MNRYDKQLSTLIEQYNIAETIPEYKKYIMARELAEEIILNQYNQEGFLIVTTDREEKDWFCLTMQIDFVFCIDEVKMDGKQSVLIVSYDEQYSLSNELYGLGYRNVIRIYDIFEEHGLYFNGPFYDIFHQKKTSIDNQALTESFKEFDPNGIIYNFRKVYRFSKDKGIKEKYLRRLIFASVFFYDFVTADLFIEEYKRLFSAASENIVLFQKEVHALLNEIKENIELRGKDDIFMIWLDQLEYGEEKNMPFISSLDQKALVFDNIYTVTPYTGPTIKTLFGKKRTIEDESYKIKKIDRENSSLLNELFKRGYDFKYYGVTKYFYNENRGNVYIGSFTPISVMFWNSIMDTLHNKRKVFNVLHSVHTHDPFVSFGLETPEYINWEGWPGQRDNYMVNMTAQKEPSKLYVDKQIAFWNEFFPENTWKIFMSDHGHTFFGKFHPFMKILRKDIHPLRYKGLLSYYDFDKILFKLLDYSEKEGISFDEQEYVPIQDVNYYFRGFILHCIKQKDFSPNGFFGYQGVITKKDLFFKTFDGRIFYQKFENDEKMVSDERLNYLDYLSMSKKTNIYEDEKFRYSRIYIQAEQRNRRRLEQRINKEKKIIEDIFNGIPNDSVFAIRCGGMHTLNLLLSIPEKLRKKVTYLIDQDKNCVASKLGIRVIDMSDAERMNVDILLISTFQNRKQILSECESLSKHIAVIDIYNKFSDANLSYNRDYYIREYAKEDFDDQVMNEEI